MSDSQHHLSIMSQDSGSDADMKQLEDRKAKKRKTEADLWATQKKGKHGITEMMDSDSDSDNSDAFVNEDDNTVNSNSSNDEVEEQESSVSQNELAADLDLSVMDTTEGLGSHDNRTSSDVENSNDGDVEDLIRYYIFSSIIDF